MAVGGVPGDPEVLPKKKPHLCLLSKSSPHMARSPAVRAFLLPGLVLVLAVVNYTVFTEHGAVHPPQALSLLIIGVLLGILLRNFIWLLRGHVPGTGQSPPR